MVFNSKYGVCCLYQLSGTVIPINPQKAEAEKLKTTLKELQKQEDDFHKKEEEITKRERVCTSTVAQLIVDAVLQEQYS